MDSITGHTDRRIPVWVWIVVGFGCFMTIGLILALLAIPTVGTMKKHANEMAAIGSLRLITQAEIQYNVTYPQNGYACSLDILGAVPGTGASAGQDDRLIPHDLAAGLKDGYVFNISNCTRGNVDGQMRITDYRLTAVPVVLGKSGDRGFCTDGSGTIKFDPNGGKDCSGSLEQ